MISTIDGTLVRLEPDRALVKVGAIGYEVMLGGYCVKSLSDKIGSEISLYTMQYLEGSPGGGNLIPRMVGFLSTTDRDFFKKFIGVKGIGIARGLRSLSMPVEMIAEAIESGDQKFLMMLPEIGKRTAEQIIVELRGKLKTFALAAGSAQPDRVRFKPFQVEALEILIAWGEKRNEAIDLIELASRGHPDVQSAEGLVPLVYRIKQGMEV